MSRNANRCKKVKKNLQFFCCTSLFTGYYALVYYGDIISNIYSVEDNMYMIQVINIFHTTKLHINYQQSQMLKIIYINIK